MGRARGKGKKFTVTRHEDPAICGEEKVLTKKQSGGAAQLIKDEIKEEESDKVEAIHDYAKTIPGQASPSLEENGKKRKRSSPVMENLDSFADGNRNGTQTSIAEIKSNGFRHTGSRRKSKPRRAAEAVLECR